MKKTKFATSIVATSLLFGGLSTALTPVAAQTTAPTKFTIIVEDKEISSDVAPIFVHDRTFVPLRALSEALGATVDYNNTTKVATLTNDGIVLTLNFKTGVVLKNGVAMQMDEAPRFVNDRALVPLRFISQAFGNEVAYDALTHTASVLPTKNTLDKRAKIKDVIDKMNTALSAVNSYEVNLNFEEKVPASPYAQATTLNGNFLLDYTQNPLAAYTKGTLHSSLSVAGAEDYNFEAYLVDGKGYLKDTTTNKWVSDTIFTAEELDKLMKQTTQQDAQSDASQKAMLPYMSMAENDNSYTISVKLDKNGLKKLDLQSNPDLQNYPSYDPGLDSMTVTMGIDKSTYLENSMSFNFASTSVGQSQPITISLTGTLGKWNAIAPIQVPDDVLKSIPASETTTN